MKRCLALLTIPVLMMVLVTPVLAQTTLPYTTVLIVNEPEAAIVVGKVTIGAGGTVSFQINEFGTDWRLAETQLYVGDEPPLKIKPNKFANQHEGLGGVASDTYYIDLNAADLNGDGILYVAARAELVRQISVKKNGKITYADETAWAQGDESMGKGKNRGMFFTVSLSPIG